MNALMSQFPDFCLAAFLIAVIVVAFIAAEKDPSRGWRFIIAGALAWLFPVLAWSVLAAHIRATSFDENETLTEVLRWFGYLDKPAAFTLIVFGLIDLNRTRIAPTR